MRVKLKNIICTTDFSDFSNQTLPYGIGLAKEFGAKLYVCHVIDLPSTPSIYGEAYLAPEAQQVQLVNKAQEQLKQLIGEKPVNWVPLVTIGHTVDEISRMVEEKDADIVISATHGRSGLKRFILGSVTERLMQTLSCPLLVVRSPEHGFINAQSEEIRLHRILVGCDFSPDSNMAFQYGLSLAQEFQSELYLVHVIGRHAYEDMLVSETPTIESPLQDLHTQVEGKLMSMVPEDARNWCTPKTDLLTGQPSEELIDYAVLFDIDLIVLGVRGHSLKEKLLVGSTTDRVVRQAPCPVLSVCPKTRTRT